MGKATVSEANQKFTDVIKTVDKEGEIILTKHGKEKYVIMTIEHYGKITDELDNKINNVKYLKDEKGNLIRTWLENETFKAIRMYEDQGDLTSYEFIKIPIDKLSITATEITGTEYSEEFIDLAFINDEDFEQNAITQLAISLYNEIKKRHSIPQIKINLKS